MTPMTLSLLAALALAGDASALSLDLTTSVEHATAAYAEAPAAEASMTGAALSEPASVYALAMIDVQAGAAGLDALFDNHHARGVFGAAAVSSLEKAPLTPIKRLLASACADLRDKAGRLRRAADECDEAVRRREMSSCQVDIVTFKLPGSAKTLSPGGARALAGRLEGAAATGDEATCAAQGGAATPPVLIPPVRTPLKPPVTAPTPTPKAGDLVPASIIRPTLRQLKAASSGTEILEFIDSRKIPIVYDNLPIGTLAQFRRATGQIVINLRQTQNGTELAAAVGHEGLHALQHLKHGALAGTIDLEQDGNFLHFAVYHEMVKAGGKTVKGTPTEAFYSSRFKALAKAGDLDGFNKEVESVYKKAGYNTLAEFRARGGAPAAQIEASARLHDARQKWARQWLTKHKGDF